jgi:hypothetical protein
MVFTNILERRKQEGKEIEGGQSGKATAQQCVTDTWSDGLMDTCLGGGQERSGFRRRLHAVKLQDQLTCRRVIEEELGKNPRESCRQVVQAPSLHRVFNERARERRRLDVHDKDGDTQTP